MSKSKSKEKIFKLLTKIPKGKVSTYSILAKISNIKSPRAVGKILHNNPNHKKYPCHRIVYKDGKLSKNFAFGGVTKQKQLLEKEGISFVEEKVEIEKHLFLF